MKFATKIKPKLRITSLTLSKNTYLNGKALNFLNVKYNIIINNAPINECELTTSVMV